MRLVSHSTLFFPTPSALEGAARVMDHFGALQGDLLVGELSDALALKADWEAVKADLREVLPPPPDRLAAALLILAILSGAHKQR